ncbi:hypothetical protein ABW20_dc0109554 [Dactylellina cionopaga]|nr:hypothetical protein ABW20_dc0109554 [Dactylellina cionopaga]
MAILPTQPEHQHSSSSTAAAVAPQSQAQEPITIPLDQPEPVVKSVAVEDGEPASPRRTPLRRDSMRRREALLKGKEGSRRRQRWENDNFLNNPSYIAPTAEDFTPHPLHPTRIVRYEFATLWDPSNPLKYGYATAHHVPSARKTGSNDEKRVPKNLKDRLKRSKGAMDLLKSLEEEVRRYAATLWGCVDEHSHVSYTEQGNPDAMDTTDDSADFVTLRKSVVEEELKDSEDEEIVFVPRMKTIMINTVPADGKHSKKGREREVYIPVLGPPLEKSVFEAPHDDQRASFGYVLERNGRQPGNENRVRRSTAK